MLLSIAVNYVGGLLAGQRDRPRLAWAGLLFAVCAGLGLLAWFKYAGFLARTICGLGFSIPIPQVTLPIGISFFTFQGLSYVIDVYRGDAPIQKNPLDTALYVALFPQLVVYPIVRYTTVMEEIAHRGESLTEFAAGATDSASAWRKRWCWPRAYGHRPGSYVRFPLPGEFQLPLHLPLGH